MKKTLKHVTILIILSSFGFTSFSQGLTQDASGKSSIIYPGTNIGLNVKDASIDFNYARFSKKTFPDTSNKARFVFGLNLKGKNEEGMGSLFSEGQFTPEVNGNLVFGVTFKEDALLSSQQLKDRRDLSNLELETLEKREFDISKKIEKEFIDLRKEMLDDFSDGLDVLIAGKMDPANKTETILDTEISSVPSVLQKHLKKQVENVLKRTLIPEQIRKELSKEFKEKVYRKDIIDIYNNTILPKVEGRMGLLAKRELQRDSISSAIDNFRDTHSLNRFTIYGSIGANTTGFKYFVKLDTTSLRKSFKDTMYVGPEFKVGINYQIGGRWLLGATIGTTRGSNFDYLTKVSYTSRNTTTLANQQLISEKAITAYTPDKVPYQYVWQNKLGLDVVRFGRIDSVGIFAFNAYFRREASKHTTIIPNISTLGVAGFFFKPNGVFLGGIYLEFNDLNNNVARFNDKPLTKFYERLNLGFVAKLAIGSRFNAPSGFK